MLWSLLPATRAARRLLAAAAATSAAVAAVSTTLACFWLTLPDLYDNKHCLALTIHREIHHSKSVSIIVVSGLLE